MSSFRIWYGLGGKSVSLKGNRDHYERWTAEMTVGASPVESRNALMKQAYNVIIYGQDGAILKQWMRQNRKLSDSFISR